MINFTTNTSIPTVKEWKRIQINSTGHAEVSYCNISHGNYSIYLSDSSNNTITNNIMFSYNIFGIYLDNSFDNLIKENEIFEGWQTGIYLKSSSHNDVIGNDIYWSAVESGIELESSSYNNIMNNNIYSNSHYGVSLYASSNNSIINNNLSYSPNENLWLSSSSNDNLIMNNEIYDSAIGIDIDSSSRNIVIDNNVFSNFQIGIFSFSSSYNIIKNNNISNNEWGIYTLSDCHHNRIFNNNILNNTIQAIDDADDNIWNDSYPSCGNYWSDFDESGEGAYDDYSGPGQNESGSDGIVDNGTIGGGGKNPYVIDTDSKDHYPLISPYVGNSTYLHQGWNLISVPLIQSNNSLEAVLQSIEGEYDAVQYFNISNKDNPWKHHHISKPWDLNDFTQIYHKIGLWVHITTPGGTLYTYRGKRLPQNQTISLYPGWNLVGYPSLNNKNRTKALNNLTFDQDVDAIWTYDSRTQKYKEIGESDYFEVGRGYYIHSKVMKTWDVPL
jgi:parallel beta-helix repeat protein